MAITAINHEQARLLYCTFIIPLIKHFKEARNYLDFYLIFKYLIIAIVFIIIIIKVKGSEVQVVIEINFKLVINKYCCYVSICHFHLTIINFFIKYFFYFIILSFSQFSYALVEL